MHPLRILLAALAASVAALAGSSPAAAPGPALRVTFLPLDRGEATLVQIPGGRVTLVGAGAPGEGARVIRHLRSRGVKQLDTLAAVTWAEKHVGGMEEVLRKLPVREFYYNPLYAATKPGDRLYRLAYGMHEARKLLNFSTPSPGESTTLFYTPPCQRNAVAPTGPMLVRFKGDARCSLVLEFNYDRVSYLDLGETTRQHRGVLWGQVDPKPWGHVLRVGREGDGDSLTPAHLRPLRTRYAVIPVARKSGRKPAAATLAALKKAGVRVYRTDLHGAVTVTTDGREIQVRTGG